MSTSAIPRQVKEYACYLFLGQLSQAQTRRIEWTTSHGEVHPLKHAKVVSLSSILVGKPGSYKSECVRFINKVCDRYNEACVAQPKQHLVPILIYPHDQCTKEMLLTTLSTMAKERGSADELHPIQTTILIDELINFLNKREYVEPLIGTLNSLLDQPPKYSVGTQRRQTEFIPHPIASIIAACAPSWFRYLPEALFTGGFSGRCAFYGVPYPKDSERQPMGSVSLHDGDIRLGKLATYLPSGDFTMDPKASNLYMNWEREFGREDAHILEALDEWYKRRAIQSARLAGCIALSSGQTLIELHHMEEADFHMKHIEKTLEKVWEEIDGDYPTRHKMLVTSLSGSEMPMSEIESIAVRYLRTPSQAHATLDWWLNHGFLKPTTGGKYRFKP